MAKTFVENKLKKILSIVIVLKYKNVHIYFRQKTSSMPALMASELEWEVDQSALHKRSWQWAGLKLQPFTRLLNTPEGLVYRSLLMVASNLWVSFFADTTFVK